MKNSIKKGFSFGVTSGIITTLGLISGLHSSTGLASVIIGGIVVIAVADAMSDALGIHISEEFENSHSTKEIWEATISTFLFKFLFAIMFVIPFIFLSLFMAFMLSIVLGFSLIIIFSYLMAKKHGSKPLHVVVEHFVIAVFVVVATHYIGDWVATFE